MSNWQQVWIDRGIPEDEWPVVVTDGALQVLELERVTACKNMPGLKRFYVTALDEVGEPLEDVLVSFNTEPSKGIAYDHPDVWGLTDEDGRLVWDHLGIATRHMIYIADETGEVEISNVRTDLGNEYCRAPGRRFGGWRPVNRPGLYSYRIKVGHKAEPE